LSTALIMLGHLDDALMVAREASQLFAQHGTLWSALDPFALLAFKRGHLRNAAVALGRAEATMQAWRARLSDEDVAVSVGGLSTCCRYARLRRFAAQ
jgi:hypothetical protein